MSSAAISPGSSSSLPLLRGGADPCCFTRKSPRPRAASSRSPRSSAVSSLQLRRFRQRRTCRLVELPWLDLRPASLRADRLDPRRPQQGHAARRHRRRRAHPHLLARSTWSDDAGKARYFGILSLFMFSMLGIVLANNFVDDVHLLGTGRRELAICSSATGSTRDAAADAANKAFITNRIGDFGFMLGILMVWTATGTVVFPEMAERTRTRSPSHPGLPHRRRAAHLLRRGRQARAVPAARLVAGRDGRPDAGLRAHPRRDDGGGRRLHAGARLLPHRRPRRSALDDHRLDRRPSPRVLAALMATQQDDIKRILAYSTLSQLGYMVMAIGLAVAAAPRCSTSSRTPSSRRCSSSAPARSSTRCITSRTSGRWAGWPADCE